MDSVLGLVAPSWPANDVRYSSVPYISPWLTHFVGKSHRTDDSRCYDVLTTILGDCTLGQWEQQGNVFISPGSMIVNSGSLCKDQFISGFRPVCFCDIPEGELGRHTRVYGRFGLAFKKDYLVAKGANPVFYVAKGSVACHEKPPIPPLTEEELAVDARAALQRHLAAASAAEVPVLRCEFFDRLVANLMRVLPPPWPAGTPADAHDPVRDVQRRVLWDLVRHVFAFTKFFDESLTEEDRANCYMEREWRVADFVAFNHDEIARIYVAPGFQDRVKRDFPGLEPKTQELT